MQRKPTKNTRGPNADEKRFQAWLKQQRCCTGGSGITEVHHCKGSTFKHNKVLIGHWFCIPLSQSSHSAYHANSKNWTLANGSQSSIWIVQHDIYVDQGGTPAPEEVIISILDWGK